MESHWSLRKSCGRVWVALGAVLGACTVSDPVRAQEPLTGSLGAHDPSTMILCEGRYYVFTTGRGIPIKVSTNKLH
jgi:hypothetical protein